MLFQTLIERKRDGGALTPGEWAAALDDYLRDEIPDCQMAALLMAVVLRGLEPAELEALTGAMLASGARLPRPAGAPPRADKHSTGGVGDKVSLVLLPVLAACGLVSPSLAGRGLGHTGGTIDKLESIPGLRTALTPEEVAAQVERIGLAIFAQTGAIAPADAKLYALRDITGTVPSIPLIAASIMSKKLAEGLDALVLDVKTGSGAFLPETARALELAQIMVGLGEAAGCRTAALVTAMDRPLGRAIGNALEVEEALQALEGQGPEDLMAVTRALAVELLVLSGVEREPEAAAVRVTGALASGRAREKFREMVAAQGGDPAVVDEPDRLPQAAAVELFEAPEEDVIAAVDPLPLGRAVVEMGGGRRRLGEAIDPSVGFVVSGRPGERVARGQPIASVFARDQAGIEVGLAGLRAAIRFGEPAALLPLIVHRVTSGGVEEG